MSDDLDSADGAADPWLDALRRLWPDDAPGSGRLGRFEVLRELGRGGMGIVYLAFDTALGCKVALKVLGLVALLSDDARRRFLNEARAAAALDHPNIVPIREAGEAGPLGYIASAYCEGPTLAAWLTERGGTLPPGDAAALVATLADAVEYMHGRGIIHRDLKPANILLAAGADGPVPRVTDFGLAKVRDGAGETTHTGAGFGTPAYMAPEQAAGARDVGATADVYSLGVILYELLTGRTPFGGKTAGDSLRPVADEEPLSPRRIRRTVPRDLEAICLECLKKEPTKRYATAKALADDLRRFLAGNPTVVRPLTVPGRAGKWLRRRSALASLMAVSVVAVMSLAAVLVADSQRQQPPDSGGDASGVAKGGGDDSAAEILAERRKDYATSIQDAWKLWEAGEFKTARAQLDRQRPRSGEDLRDFEWFCLWRLLHPQPLILCDTRYPFFALALSKDGQTLAAAGPGTIHSPPEAAGRLWDTATWTLRGRLQNQEPSIYSLSFSPDGKVLAAGGGLGDHDGHLQLWKVPSGELYRGQVGFPGSVEAVAYSPDGKYLAACGPAPPEGEEKDTRILDAQTLILRHEVGCSPRRTGRRATSLAFSPMTGELAVGWGCAGYGGAVGLRDFFGLSRGKITNETPHLDQVLCVAYSPHGDWLACGSMDNSVSVQHTDGDGRSGEISYLRVRSARVRKLAFAPDGQCLAAGYSDGAVKLWDFPSRKERLAYIPAHNNSVRGLTFTSDGQSLVTASEDGTVKVWGPMDVHRVITLPGHGKSEAWSVAISPDGKTLASGGHDRVVRLWDMATGKPGAVLEGHDALVNCVAFSPDGKTLASVANSREEPRTDFLHMVKLWDVDTGKELQSLTGHRGDVRWVAFSPDGKLLATGSRDHTVLMWRAEGGAAVAMLTGHSSDVRSLAFSPDSKTLASASHDGTVLLWDVELRLFREPLKHGRQVWSVAFAPDGKTVATGDDEGTVRLWRVETGQLEFALSNKENKERKGVRAVVFSPNGRTLAAGSEDRTIRIWQAATGDELLSFPDQPNNVNALAFAPDGRTLAAALNDGLLRIWRAPLADD
jgi:WD40 repeat protein/serine/threonine protein kinase